MEKLRYIASLIAIALMTGATSTLFLKSLEWTTSTRLQYPSVIFFLPLAGVFLIWAYQLCGTQLLQGNIMVHNEMGTPTKRLPRHLAPMIFTGTLFSHFFGASVGREGTAIQYGASFSDWFYQGEKRRLFLHAGVSAGFASVFGTPWAGVIFALESSRYFRDYTAIGACLLSAWMAHYFAVYLGAPHSHYSVELWPNLSPTLLAMLALSGLFFGVCARAYVSLKKLIAGFLPQHRMKKIFCAGLAVSSYVYFSGNYKMLGLSLPVISDSFVSVQDWSTPFVKLFLTAISTGGGFLGGEVTPLFMIGASLGSALSQAMSPLMAIPLDFLAAMGLVAVFSGAARVPLASTIMACELFGISAAPYAIVACFVSHLMNRNLHLYKS